MAVIISYKHALIACSGRMFVQTSDRKNNRENEYTHKTLNERNVNDIRKANEVKAMQKYAFTPKMCVFFIGNGYDVVNIANFFFENLH